jgi:phenol/toluene 2-monooxygenase (NADH) P1/A1
VTSIDLQTRDIKPLRNTYTHVARYIGGDKPASRYQEATMGAQPTQNFHYRPTWDPRYELFDASRSAIKLNDWYVLKDPRQYYYATWTIARAKQQEAVESNYQFVDSRGLLNRMSDEIRATACQVLMPLRHVAWAGNMNNCFITAYGYGTALTAATMFHSMDHLGVAQYLTRLGLAVDEPGVLEAGKNDWLEDPRWQVLRRLVEDTLVLQDPMEMFVAQNLAIDGNLYPLIYGAFIDDYLTPRGGTAIAMLTSFMPEWFDETSRWVDAVCKAAAAESPENKALMSQWAKVWGERAQAALAPVAAIALGAEGEAAMAGVRETYAKRCAKVGLAV